MPTIGRMSINNLGGIGKASRYDYTFVIPYRITIYVIQLDYISYMGIAKAPCYTMRPYSASAPR